MAQVDHNSEGVEVSPGSRRNVGVRDSYHPTGAWLIFSEDEWAGFPKATRSGLHDLP